MKQNRRKTTFISVLFLLALAACVIPGMASQGAPAPGPDAISTFIAGTAAAAASQTAAVPADAPPASGMIGTALEKLPDGTTRYTDYDAGYELTFPVGWLALRPNSEEFNAALVEEGSENQELHSQMTLHQSLYEGEWERLYSYPIRPDLMENVIFGFSKLYFKPEDSEPIDNYALGQLIAYVEGPDGIPYFRVVTSSIYDNRNGVTTMQVGGPFHLENDQELASEFYATIIYFKPAASTLVGMTFTIVKEYQETLAPDIKSVIDSIRLLGR
jgi:hypothetical protein